MRISVNKLGVRLRSVLITLTLLFISVNLFAQTEVVLWTNQNLHGYIKVYHNNKYVGQITKYSSTPPKPHTAGFVTLTISGSNNTFYAEAQDGTRWYSEKMTLQPGNYYTIRLYGSSSSTSNSSSSNRSSSSSSYSGSSYSSSSSSTSTAGNIGGQIGTAVANTIGGAAMRASTISMEGYPNLQVQTGYSLAFGEYVGIGSDLGGMGGAYFQGAVHRDFFAKEHVKAVDAWGVRVGFYGGDEKNTFRFIICLYQKYTLPKNPSAVGVELNYARYFTSRIGLNGGIGAYGYDKPGGKSGFLFDANIGLVYKILSN